MTYRDTLQGAYRRIDDLESRLGSREAEIARLHRELVSLRAARPITSLGADEGPITASAPLEAASAPPEAPSLLHAIPVPITVALVSLYLGRFGTSLPTCMDDWLPFERASLLSAIAGGVVMAVRYAALVRTRRSTIADRLLLFLATTIALPFLIPVGLFAVHVGGVVAGIVTSIATVGLGVYAGVKWIVNGSSNEPSDGTADE